MEQRNAVHASSREVPNDDAARQLLITCLSKSWSNPRKRPSASTISDVIQHDSVLPESGKHAVQPYKRSRVDESLIEGATTPTARPVTPRRATKAPLSPGQRHNLTIKPRPSKFLESSMHDRVSTKPPSIYMQDEIAMDQYHNGGSRHVLGSYDSNNTEYDKNYYDADIEPTKASGMYRFGRALVSVFNPVNVWQGINGIWKDKEQNNHQEKGILDQRKIKAEKAYAEMKRNGIRGTRPSPVRKPSVDESPLNGSSSQSESMDPRVRNPDTHAQTPHPSVTFEHGWPTPTGSEDLLIPPAFTGSSHAAVSAFQGEHGCKTSSLHRPSFQSLKKVKSHVQLPSKKRKTADAATLPPRSDASHNQQTRQALRRQPSRKDVAKRQKLSKQVSNLENKLEAARRELKLCDNLLPEVPRIPDSARKSPLSDTQFSLSTATNPGPIESAAKDRIDSEWQPLSSRKMRKANLTPRKGAVKDTTAKTLEPLTAPKPNRAGSSSTKRKSSGQKFDNMLKPTTSSNSDSDCGSNISAREVRRARKAQRLGGSPTVHADAAAKKSPASASKQNMPKNQASVLPVPPLVTFAPTKVDKHKLSTMRSIPRDSIHFGSHSNDTVNLHQGHPELSHKQLDEYPASLPRDDTATENPKNSENQRPNAPSSTELGSASLTKTSTVSDAPLNSRKQMGKELSTIDETVSIDPSTDKSIPPIPKSSFMKTHGLKAGLGHQGKLADKPLPKIQREDYKWPEDVF
ncbi:MAG: hypothetical protein Q9219_004676 [cf. Caloplaca sp. 3 TL-2023]